MAQAARPDESVNLAAAADMMVKLAFRRQQTDKLKKEMFAAAAVGDYEAAAQLKNCLLYTSPSPRDRQKSRMPSSA